MQRPAAGQQQCPVDASAESHNRVLLMLLLSKLRSLQFQGDMEAAHRMCWGLQVHAQYGPRLQVTTNMGTSLVEQCTPSHAGKAGQWLTRTPARTDHELLVSYFGAILKPGLRA